MMWILCAVAVVSLALKSVVAAPLTIEERAQSACKKTKVAVLGAGAAGVFAAVNNAITLVILRC